MFYFFSMDLLDELKKELEESIESEKTKTHTLQMENKVCLKSFSEKKTCRLQKAGLENDKMCFSQSEAEM